MKMFKKAFAVFTAMSLLFFSSVTSSVAFGSYSGTEANPVEVSPEAPVTAFGWAAIGAAVAGAVAVSELAGAAYDAGTYIGEKLGTSTVELTNSISQIQRDAHNPADFSQFDV